MKKLLLFASFSFLIGCDNSEEIKLELPEHDEQLAVECYLEDGKPMRAFLSQSVGYFENESIDMKGAYFKISSPDGDHVLKNENIEDPDYKKFYNYVSENTINIKPGDVLEVFVEDELGRKIRGTTKALEKVEIDTVMYKFHNSNQTSPIIFFHDDPNEKNYYRLTFSKLKSGIIEQDLVIDDYLFNGNGILNAGYSFYRGDHIEINLFHIDEKYYEYLKSIQGAKNANFSAFTQPYPISSTVDEGIGVFTVLIYDRITMKLE